MLFLAPLVLSILMINFTYPVIFIYEWTGFLQHGMNLNGVGLLRDDKATSVL